MRCVLPVVILSWIPNSRNKKRSVSSIPILSLMAMADTVTSESLFQSRTIRWLEVSSRRSSLFCIVNILSLGPLVPCFFCLIIPQDPSSVLCGRDAH